MLNTNKAFKKTERHRANIISQSIGGGSYGKSQTATRTWTRLTVCSRALRTGSTETQSKCLGLAARSVTIAHLAERLDYNSPTSLCSPSRVCSEEHT